MEEKLNNVKIAYTKNLSKQMFNTVLSVPIDNNVNVKTILNISTYLFDEKAECGNGKAIISGRMGVKVLYIDTDNQTNTISTNQPFSETILDSTITADCYINIADRTILNSILSTDGVLKINCEISFNPIAYMNLGLENNSSLFDNLICKKNEIQAKTISNIIKKEWVHTAIFETKDSISKVLSHNAYFTVTKVSSNDGYAIIEGKILSHLVYETSGEETKIKELQDSFNIKTDLEIENLSKDGLLDLSFVVDQSKEDLSTEFEDDNSIITIKNTICVNGVELKNISLELIDDAYSTENEIELTHSSRDYLNAIQHFEVNENIFGEITLNGDEPAIDEIISNLNISPEITNSYMKDGELVLEGVVTSCLVLIDENREYRQKETTTPFSINSKIKMDELACIHSSANVLDCKVKIRRGTIIELEYSLEMSVCTFSKETTNMVGNVTLGKSLDFSNYDYQIFLAKPGETLWELCKRTKTNRDALLNSNKNLPLVMNGGEKIIVKR